MPGPFVLFLAAPIVVVVVVVFLIVSGRLRVQADLTIEQSGTDFRSLLQFSKEKHERIGEYVRGNWSGAPEQLPHVLGALLAELERDSQARGLTVDRDILKSILAASIRAHRIGRRRDLNQALTRVA